MLTQLQLLRQSTRMAMVPLPVAQGVLTTTRMMLSTVSRPQGRVVILGTGWAGFTLMKQLSAKNYDVVVVSPRNHFLFTPLLASACVGTLEFRCVTEPVRQSKRDITFYQATCEAIDFNKKELLLSPAIPGLEDPSGSQEPIKTVLPYDKLVIACGAVPNTFGIPGVKEHALLLKQVADARKIRQRIIECFEYASEPGVSEQEKQHILNFVVVGAGPTGVEFSGELYDFATTDVVKLYPDLKNHVRITLIEASPRILTSFDSSLGEYAAKRFARQGIQIEKGVSVKEVKPGKVLLQDGRTIDCGLVVWSTGFGATDLVKKLALKKDKGHRIITDGHLRPMAEGSNQVIPDVYALGDCATVENANHAATAQMAKQKALYLAKTFQKMGERASQGPFEYHHAGAMAYIGGWKALFDSEVKVSGFSAWLLWRSAYLTMTVSTKNKILIPMYWLLTFLFGRDTTKF